MDIQSYLTELSDLIDMHKYIDDWEAKAQDLITDISDFLKEKEVDNDDKAVPSLLDE